MAKVSLKDVGWDLVFNDFVFTPIKPKSKIPMFKGWSERNFKAEHEGWLKTYPTYGAGILTKTTPAVDLDISDVALVEHMADWIELSYGEAPTRIGRDPKRLTVYRLSGKAFPTMKSVWYEGEKDRSPKHEVQILGDGQQFIAFGIHPDTGKPYKWTTDANPTNTSVDELPEMSEERGFEIIAEFDRMCELRGWNHTTAVRGQSLFDDSDEDDFEQDEWVNNAIDSARAYDGDMEELERKVMLIPGAEDYHKWIQVLAALQTDVDDQDRAYDIALKWSAQAHNFDQDAFDQKWDEGFKHEKRKLLTYKSLLQEANEIEEKQRAEAVEELIPMFVGATTREEWMDAASKFRQVKMFGLARADVTKVACDKYAQIMDRKLSPPEIKKNLSYRIDPDDLPGWLTKFAFNVVKNEFVNIRNGVCIPVQGFDAAMRRYMVDEDPDTTPSKLALDLYRVPVIEGVMYNPLMHGETENGSWKAVRECSGRPEFFKFFASENLAFSDDNASIFLNTFKPATMAEVPDDYSRREKQAVDIMKDFFFTQFPNAKERAYVMDFVAHIVKYPGRRINYAMIVHGCPGSGKTIIGEMLRSILGDDNVGAVSNSDLQSSFTKWAEGSIVKIVEEVSVVGHGYDVLNNIKDKIANPIISVRRMREDSLKVQNTASYIFLTNDPAALPIDDNDRRYMVVSSKFQDRTRDLLPFLKEEPKFFKTFDTAFKKYPGALRKYFCEEYEFSPGFNPYGGQAPTDTEARQRMLVMAKDDFTEAVTSLTAECLTPNVTQEIVFMPDLMEAMKREIDDFKAPQKRSVQRKMEAAGFYKVGSSVDGSIRLAGVKGRCYARSPRTFEDVNGYPDLDKIRKVMAEHNAQVPEPEETFDEDMLL